MSKDERDGTTVCEHGAPTDRHCFMCCKRDECAQCDATSFRLTPVAKAAMDLIMSDFKTKYDAGQLTLSDLVTLFQRGADWQRGQGAA